jgi:hypothetical protein
MFFVIELDGEQSGTYFSVPSKWIKLPKEVWQLPEGDVEEAAKSGIEPREGWKKVQLNVVGTYGRLCAYHKVLVPCM